MTKADLVEAVYAQLEGGSRVSKRESSELVDLVFDTHKETPGSGDWVRIRGSGRCVVRPEEPRV